jgi:PPK2 family polyphosphate:nucleotide phosphotransferase
MARGERPAADPARRAEIAAELRVAPGERANLTGRTSRWVPSEEWAHLDADDLDDEAKKILRRGVDELSDAQELLWASSSRAVLVVFQAMDAAGKDSTIEHVMSGVNPQGVDVVSFRKPTEEELAHPFLWRVWKVVPAKGRIGIFNRSHYEEVVALHVHPEWLAAQQLPTSVDDDDFWQQRYDDINAFERHLANTGTAVVKFFLNVSREEQLRRFLRRLDNPDKEWKFNAADVAERERWDDYQEAFERAISATSTPWAPWYVIPADSKPVMQAMVATLLVDLIDSLGLDWPAVSDDERAANAAARQRLLAEADRTETTA